MSRKPAPLAEQTVASRRGADRAGVGRSGQHRPQPIAVVGVAALMLAGVSCVPTNDHETTDLSVVAAADTPEVFEGQAVVLTASASRGTPPYLYRWDQNAGPERFTLTDVTAATWTTEPLTAVGRYVFRVTAMDGEGFHAIDFVAVKVLPAVEASAPNLAIVGEPVALQATIEATAPDLELRWEVVRGEAVVADETAPATTLTTSAGETVEVMLTLTLPSVGATPVTTTRTFEVVSVPDLRPQVLIETNLGAFTLELEGEAAPLHTVNFLLYVDDGFYDGLLFHRVVCSENEETDGCEPFVVQAGAYRRVDEALELQESTRDPVESATDNGLSNGVLYSVALALTGSDMDSGATQFFINLDEDNAFLDDEGFTVFARVVEGTDVVDAIAVVETTDSPVIPFELSLPVEDIIVERVTRVNP